MLKGQILGAINNYTKFADRLFKPDSNPSSCSFARALSGSHAAACRPRRAACLMRTARCQCSGGGWRAAEGPALMPGPASRKRRACAAAADPLSTRQAKAAAQRAQAEKAEKDEDALIASTAAPLLQAALLAEGGGTGQLSSRCREAVLAAFELHITSDEIPGDRVKRVAERLRKQHERATPRGAVGAGGGGGQPAAEASESAAPAGPGAGSGGGHPSKKPKKATKKPGPARGAGGRPPAPMRPAALLKRGRQPPGHPTPRMPGCWPPGRLIARSQR
eukprot:SAG22_NODE_144_length_17700_cov_21.959207_6_plen_277_part_00